MFLACGAQKENLMAADFSTSPGGNGRAFIIKPLFKKSAFTDLANTYLVSSFGATGLELITWRQWKRTQFTQFAVD